MPNSDKIDTKKIQSYNRCMKKAFFSFSALLFLLLFVSCAKGKSLTLNMAESNSIDSPAAHVDQIFIDKVAELSKGSIKINLQANGIFGNNAIVTEAMTKPDCEIHLARISPASLIQYDCSKSSLLMVPFTFSNRKHFWAFASSSAANEILNEPYEKGIGVKGLFFSEEGFRHFFSTSRIKDINDFSGKKIRITNNEIMLGIAKSLKSEAVNIGFNELYAALQTGRVDIAEQPIVNYLSSHFNKVAPYMILDRHILGVTEVVISSKVWDSLSKKQKNIFYEAAEYAREYCQTISYKTEEEAKETLRKEGVEFIDVTDITPWQNVCADVINRAVASDPTLYGEILTLAE